MNIPHIEESEVDMSHKNETDESTNVSDSLPLNGILLEAQKGCNSEVDNLFRCIEKNPDFWLDSCSSEMLAINKCTERLFPEITKFRRVCGDEMSKFMNCIKNDGDSDECTKLLSDAINCNMDFGIGSLLKKYN